MKLSITIQTPEVKQAVPVSLLSGTLGEKISKACLMGVNGLELMTTFPEDLDAAGIYDSIVEKDMQISAISSGALAFTLGITLLHSDKEVSTTAIQRLHRLIEFASKVQAPVVTIGSFRGRLGNTANNEGYSQLTAILRDAADYAQSLSVRLALEPLNRYETDFITNAEEGLNYLAQVDHPAIGLLLDTYHVNLEESSWTEPFRQVMAAGKLFHIHIGDNNRLPPGRGLIAFPEIVSTLDQICYIGYLSAELLGKPDPDTAAKQTIAYMRSLISK